MAMAPYNNNYWNNYPQQQSQQYEAERSTNYQENAYQNSTTVPNHGRWYPQATPSTTNESRAAETLSALSTQEPAYGSGHGVNSMNPSYASQGWGPVRQTQLPNTMATSSRQQTTYDTTLAANTAHYNYGTNANANSSTTVQARPYAAHSSQAQSYATHPTGIAQSGVPQAGRLSDYNNSTGPPSTSPSIRQSSYPSKDPPAAQHGGSHQDAKSSGGQSQMQSLTPSAIQQQAYNAPPPPTTTAPSIAHITVDPSQVYDPYLERQRQAEKAAEERRKRDAEEAKKKAANEAKEGKKKAHENSKIKKAGQVVESEPVRKEARVAKNAGDEREKLAGLSHAKQLSASAIAAAVSSEGNDGEDMESEMRAMFQKMRQFNAMNPKMLAKMWEEERQAHTAKPAATDVTSAAGASAAISPATTAVQPPANDDTAPATKAKARRNYVKKAKQPVPGAATEAASEVDKQSNEAASSLQALGTTAVASPVQTHTSAPPPKQQSAASTVWPPGRKQLLSEVAAKWLNSRKENSGKSISPERLAELLDGNPSYPVLCSTIEQMGFTLDRGLFARTLLRAVPDLNKPSTLTLGSAPQPLSSAKPAVQASLEAEAAASSVRAGAPQMAGIDPAISFQLANKPVASIPSGLLQNNDSLVDRIPDAAKPAPQERSLTKEQAARKRNFSDLVDLTNEDDSDKEDFPPPKIPNVGQYANFSIPSTMNAALPQNLSDTLSPAVPMGYLKPPQVKSLPREAELKGKSLVKPILREKVARRSVYDPRTIARDVLLATGRHPEMRALNAHLLYMQPLLSDHSDGVEMHKYDLATVRWDLIDPGDPVESDEDVRSDDGSEADDESNGPSIRGVGASSRAVPGSGLGGTATLAEEPLPLPLPMRSLKAGWKAKRGRSRSSMPKANAGASLAGNAASSQNLEFRPFDRTAAAGNQPASSANHTASPGSAVGYAAFNQQNLTYDENGKPIKKKGRPVGWRKAVHGKEAQGIQPGGSPSTLPNRTPNNPSGEVKRRGRPPKNPTLVSPSVVLPDPQYTVWRCQWEGCHSELHNLDTLRKHLVKVHGLPHENVFHCRWGACSAKGPSGSPIGKGKARADMDRQQFPSIHKWMKHLEPAHLLPLARSLGDGPRSGLSDAYDSEASQNAYLSDVASGRLITPRATPLADVPEAAAADAAAQASPLAPVLRRGMPRVRGILSTSQREDEHKLQQLEAKKLTLGPLLDCGGARLATDRRRNGLYDDEDFEGDFTDDDGPSGDEDGL